MNHLMTVVMLGLYAGAACSLMWLSERPSVRQAGRQLVADVRSALGR